MDNYFTKLNQINVNEKVEKKNGLSYLSWAYAWGEIKKMFPNATYTIYENYQGWNYFTDGKTGWVKTGVTVEGIEHIEYLPIMDFRNNSISIDKITSFDVNKAIQRSLTKAVARHGLGLYVYAGEDLPEQECAQESKEEPKEMAAEYLTNLMNNIKPKEEDKEEEEIFRQDLISELQDLGSKLSDVAVYFKTTPEKLTVEQLKKAISMKRGKQ